MKHSALPSPAVGPYLRLGYMYGGVVVYQAGESLALRKLTDYELVLIIEGKVSYISDDRVYAVPPGGIILGRPGFREQYRWDPRQRTRHAYFHFSIDQIPSDWPAPEKWPRTRPDPNPVIVALFRHVMQHINEHPRWPAETPKRGDCRVVEALMDAFLERHGVDEARVDEKRPEPVGRALKRMREIIDEDPGHAVNLTDLAKASNVTEKHLCRLFTHTMGHSPMQTYGLLRLQLAMALLARSNLNIKEIAERCGYDNPLYFSRVFAKTYGAAPSHIRESLLRGKPPPPNPLPTDITPRVYW